MIEPAVRPPTTRPSIRANRRNTGRVAATDAISAAAPVAAEAPEPFTCESTKKALIGKIVINYCE